MSPATSSTLVLDPGLLSSMASCDVASDIRRARPDIARHVIDTHIQPWSLSLMASCDVASHIHKALSSNAFC
jgi:hypothetical protein